MDQELPLRIVLVDPPPGVAFRLQHGKSGLVAPVLVGRDSITFDFSVRLGDSLPDGRPRFLGGFAQGPPQARFVYVNSGTLAGEVGTQCTRRAKVHLSSISSALVEKAAQAGARLEVRIAGKAKDGGPACATVPLLGKGWTLIEPREP